MKGVYVIQCIPTGKTYVGSSIRIEGRWADHRNELRGERHTNTYLQNAWNKYGEQAFEFSVFHKMPGATSEELIASEASAIFVVEPEYNVVKDPTLPPSLDPSVRAKTWTPEARARQSARASVTNKRRVLSESTKAKISASLTGLQRSDASKAKQAATMLGRTWSEEAKAKASTSLRGHPVSDATKAKIAAKAKGRKHSAEARAKMSASRKGRKAWNKGVRTSDEVRAKISAAGKGLKRSAKTCRRISEAQKGKVIPLEQTAKMMATRRRLSAERPLRDFLAKTHAPGYVRTMYGGL